MDPYKHRPSSAYNSPFWTTNSGAPVWNNNSSLTIGSRGPILLEDYHLVEKIAQFYRECVPKKVVHARGASAKDPIDRAFLKLLYMSTGVLKLSEQEDE